MGSFAADHLVRDGPAFVEVGPRGRRRRRAGPADDRRHHPDPPGDRLRLPAAAASRSATAPVRRVEEFKEKPAVRRGAALRRLRALPVERQHVRLAGRRLPRRAGPPAARRCTPGCAAIAAAWDTAEPRRGARRDLADAAEDLRRLRGDGGRGRGRPGRHRARRLRLERRRRLPHPRRRAAAPTAPATWSSTRGTGEPKPDGAAARQRPAASWCRSRAGWSPRSACATWSSSTRPTRCWSAPATAPRTSRQLVDELKERGEDGTLTVSADWSPLHRLVSCRLRCDTSNSSVAGNEASDLLPGTLAGGAGRARRAPRPSGRCSTRARSRRASPCSCSGTRRPLVGAPPGVRRRRENGPHRRRRGAGAARRLGLRASARTSAPRPARCGPSGRSSPGSARPTPSRRRVRAADRAQPVPAAPGDQRRAARAAGITPLPPGERVHAAVHRARPAPAAPPRPSRWVDRLVHRRPAGQRGGGGVHPGRHAAARPALPGHRRRASRSWSRSPAWRACSTPTRGRGRRSSGRTR